MFEYAGRSKTMGADGIGAITDLGVSGRLLKRSPQGTKIVFSYGAEGSDEDAFIVDADGSNKINLTANEYSNYFHRWAY